MAGSSPIARIALQCAQISQPLLAQQVTKLLAPSDRRATKIGKGQPRFTAQVLESPQATVFIVDDDAFNRSGLHQYLSLNHFTVIEAGDHSTAWALFQSHPTDATVIDLSIPERAGMRARPSEAQGFILAQQIKQHYPQTAVVIFSAYEDRVAEVVQLMRQSHGEIAYILKGCAPERLFDALQATLRGQVIVDPEVSQPNRFAQLLLAQLEPGERAPSRQRPKCFISSPTLSGRLPATSVTAATTRLSLRRSA